MLGDNRGAQPEEFVEVILASEPDIDVHAFFTVLGSATQAKEIGHLPRSSNGQH